MTASLGKIRARLAEPEESLPDGLVDLINENIKPPTPIKPDDVFIRAMYIVSDQVNSFGGRFPLDEHERLSRLLINAPVLVGHRKDKLPVGRNFHAVTLQRDGVSWVKSYFYWLRSAAQSEELRENIDGGIYKECSIAFTFNLPQCSICDKDIRTCPHEPFRSYQTNRGKEICHFAYRQIEKVLETSLVYRGANPGTSVSKDLDETKSKAAISKLITPLDKLEELSPGKRLLITPSYDGIHVTAGINDGRFCLTDSDGDDLGAALSAQLPPDLFESKPGRRGVLVGYRGKDRVSSKQLSRYLHTGCGPVSRVVLNLMPTSETADDRTKWRSGRSALRLIPHRIGSRQQVERMAREIMTRDGVEIRYLDEGTDSNVVYHYKPTDPASLPKDRYELIRLPGTDQALLRLVSENDNSGAQVYRLRFFDPEVLKKGESLITESVTDRLDDHEKAATVVTGRLSNLLKSNGAVVVTLDGYLSGSYQLRPATINGRPMFLFSRRRELSKKDIQLHQSGGNRPVSMTAESLEIDPGANFSGGSGE